MILRYFPAEGEPLLPKAPDVHIQYADSFLVLGSEIEVVSKEELIVFQEDFERYSFSIHPDDLRLFFEKRMKIQARHPKNPW